MAVRHRCVSKEIKMRFSKLMVNCRISHTFVFVFGRWRNGAGYAFFRKEILLIISVISSGVRMYLSTYIEKRKVIASPVGGECALNVERQTQSSEMSI